MQPREGQGRPALIHAATIGAILAAFVLVRLPLLTRDASARGWNGDSAIYGLMAKKIHDGKGFDVFFWGQNYMGPLTPALAALIRKTVLDPGGFGPEGGPVALRLASMSEIAFGICLYVLGLARLFGPAIAAAAGFWMAISPPFLILLSAVHLSGLGPEMSFALGSVPFFLAAGALTRPRPFLDRPAGHLLLGVLAGLGWWMNQTIAFVLLPVAALVLFRSWRSRMRVTALVLCGFAVGHAPVWIGRLAGWYEPGAGPYVQPWQTSGLPARVVRFLESDSWQFVGLDGFAPPPLLAAAALVLLGILVLRYRRRVTRSLRTEPLRLEGPDLAFAIAGLGAAVFFFKNFNAAGDRYLAPVLPAALAVLLVSFAEGMSLLRKKIPSAVAALLVGGFALSVALFLSRQARDTVRSLLREPDPRALLRTIADGGYAVCHAGYDTAYTLQFLSDERVRFVPFHSPDRNRTLSAELRAIPGPQCLVTSDGTVRRWLPSDAEQEGAPRRNPVVLAP